MKKNSLLARMELIINDDLESITEDKVVIKKYTDIDSIAIECQCFFRKFANKERIYFILLLAEGGFRLH
jgi:hypothetical protein